MFIDLGNDNTVRSREILSIVDHSVVTSSSIMGELIGEKKEQGKAIGLRTVAKSIVITDNLIYYSSLSVPTLIKRSSFISIVKKLEGYSCEI